MNIKKDDKKKIIPIFPLSGVIFFPNTNLPLNIFEDKYLEMVRFALSRDKEIGMIQTKNNNDLYEVGCYGKISNFDKAEDGRYLINLMGINYFKIYKEINTEKKFRLAKINFVDSSNFEFHFNEKKFNKKEFLKKYIFFIESNNLQINLKKLKIIDSPYLIKFIAMTSPFADIDKQMLLETFDINKLANNLIVLFDFYSSYNEDKITIN